MKKYLLDTSVWVKFEEIFISSGINILEVLEKSSKASFYSTNDVFVELLNGPRVISPNFIGKHIVNSGYSGDPRIKENKFLSLDDNGKIIIISLNKVSHVDFGQVLFCQNNLDYVLVSNDHKLLKSSRIILKNRVIGTPNFLEELVQMHPKNKNLIHAYKTALKLFEMKKVSNDYSFK